MADPSITASLYIGNSTNEVTHELAKHTSVNKKSSIPAVCAVTMKTISSSLIPARCDTGLPVLPQENKNLLEELKQEIAFFIHYLIERPFTTQPATRMWFKPEQIVTSASYSFHSLASYLFGLLLLLNL